MKEPLIVIGAGLAAWTVVREFRKRDGDTPVLMLTADSGDFYAKPSLSNAFAQQRTPAQLVTTPAATLAQTLNVTLRPYTRVLGIDPATRTVHTGTAPLAYSQLVLATGAQAVRVPLAGDAAAEVLSVNSLEDFAVFHAALAQAAPGAGPRKQVLVMGAGLIGCEFANDLAAAGHPVHVVDPSARPLSALLPAGAGAELQQALGALGVAWHFGTTVQAVDYRDPAQGAAGGLRVTLANGEVLNTDVVLSAVGLRADTSLARAAGLVCERGVVVDALLQTSAPGVHALGDCAQYADGHWPQAPVAGGRTLPYVMPIMNAARALAATLAGTPTPLVFPLMPVAIKTPALPIVAAPPPPGSVGEWLGRGDGLWHFAGADGGHHGFVLSGAHTARRGEQARLLA